MRRTQRGAAHQLKLPNCCSRPPREVQSVLSVLQAPTWQKRCLVKVLPLLLVQGLHLVQTSRTCWKRSVLQVVAKLQQVCEESRLGHWMLSQAGPMVQQTYLGQGPHLARDQHCRHVHQQVDMWDGHTGSSEARSHLDANLWVHL